MNEVDRYFEEFGDFWDQHLGGVRHFSEREILFLGTSNKWRKSNSYPPRGLWVNVIQAVRMADEIRDRFGYPLRVVSAYRNRKYNVQVGGAVRSRHLRFMALDLMPVGGGDVRDLVRIAREVRDEFGCGGVGGYRGFVHLDCRKSLANW